MYALILIVGLNVSPVGTYSSLNECQSNLAQFEKIDVKAACVKQQSAEDASKQVQVMFGTFQKMMAQMQAEMK